MVAEAYLGHADDSASKLAAENPDNVPPADEPGYDPAEFTSEPGAAARAAGWPRADGRPGTAKY